MNKTIAVYGTLKRGYGLHHHYLKNEEFIKDDTATGTLYSCGSLPYFMDKGKDKIHVEVYKVSRGIFNRIKNMEEGAGYKTKLIKLNSGTEAHVFTYPFFREYMNKINKF